MSWISTSDQCKEYSPEKLNKERMKKQSQDFEAYQKETLVCRQKKITWWRTSSAQQKCGEDFL
jgi:hypothetical protein